MILIQPLFLFFSEESTWFSSFPLWEGKFLCNLWEGKCLCNLWEGSGHGFTWHPAVVQSAPGLGRGLQGHAAPSQHCCWGGREGGLGRPQQDPQTFLKLIDKGAKPSPAGPYTSVGDVSFCLTEIDGPGKEVSGLAQPGEKVLSTAL